MQMSFNVHSTNVREDVDSDVLKSTVSARRIRITAEPSLLQQMNKYT